jgi:hypothetical protein
VRARERLDEVGVGSPRLNKVGTVAGRACWLSGRIAGSIQYRQCKQFVAAARRERRESVDYEESRMFAMDE